MSYRYIKGREVILDEHMLSATELAKIYGLFSLTNNPNGFLISHIIADYIKVNNLNVSDYYYPYRQGVMKVYPRMLYEDALENFVFDLEENKEYVFITTNAENKKIKINYKFIKPKHGSVISFNDKERKK